MRKEFEAVRELLMRGTRQVKLNDVWYDIHRRLKVGEVTNRGTLALNEDEKGQLRFWVKDETGIDPLQREHLPGASKNGTAQPQFQKPSPRAVFGRMLRLARAGGGEIPLKTGSARVPSGAMLSVEPEYIDLSSEVVLVVDNGSLVRDWSNLHLPKELSSAVIIFRGQERDAVTLMSVIDEQRPKLNVGFYDFTPEGMKMGLLAEHDALLIPARWIEMGPQDGFFQANNHTELFTSQVEALVYLQEFAPKALHPLLAHMKSHKMALAQEDLVKQEERLLLMPLKTLM